MSTLKFTGTFKNLKKLGFDFMKLYASNYKVYNKKLGENPNSASDKFWIWVANGGYIELNDLYGNTENIIKGLSEIDFDKIEFRKSRILGDYKRMYINFNHNDTSKGYEIVERSLEDLYFDKIFKQKELSNITKEDRIKIRAEIHHTYDRSFFVSPERKKLILDEYYALQKS